MVWQWHPVVADLERPSLAEAPLRTWIYRHAPARFVHPTDLWRAPSARSRRPRPGECLRGFLGDDADSLAAAALHQVTIEAIPASTGLRTAPFSGAIAQGPLPRIAVLAPMAPIAKRTNPPTLLVAGLTTHGNPRPCCPHRHEPDASRAGATAAASTAIPVPVCSGEVEAAVGWP